MGQMTKDPHAMSQIHSSITYYAPVVGIARAYFTTVA